MFHNIIFSTSENMQAIANETVQTIVTSPPYWDLKNYDNHSSQIGFNEDYQQYLDRMNLVWRECKRVLKEEGSLFININYRRIGNQILRIHDDFIKQLVKIGFLFQQKIIWHKPSGIPTAQPRLADRYEYILHFSIKPTFAFYQVAYNDYKNNLPNYIYNSWRIVKKAGSIGKKFPHPAMFPIEMAQRTILLTSKENDIVLDPFLGSGSTLIAAIRTGRSAYGYELNIGYKELIEYRLEAEFGMFKNIVFSL